MLYLNASGQTDIPDAQKISMPTTVIGRHHTKVYEINDLPFANNAESEVNNTEIAKFDDHFEAKKLMNSYITKVYITVNSVLSKSVVSYHSSSPTVCSMQFWYEGE